MKLLQVVCVLFVIVVGPSCAIQPRTIKQYSKDGVSFAHYSDWRVTEDEPIDGDPNTRSIHIEGPDDALIMFICIHPLSSMTAATFAASLAADRQKSLEQKYKLGPIKPIDVTRTTSAPTVGRVGGQMREGVIQRFSVQVLGEVVPHECRVYTLDTKRYHVFVVAQVAVEDLDHATPSFELTLDSFSVAEK